MRVLVTGERGFVGSHLLERLSRDPQFSVVPLGKHDVRESDWFVLHDDISVVVHLAARISRDAEDKEAWDVNVRGTENVVSFCKRSDARLVFASTNVYGKPKELPVTEEHPLDPANPYTKSKAEAERVIRESGIDATVLRFSNIYGKGQRGRFIVPGILAQLPSGKVHLDTASTKRDYVYVDDAVDAIVRAILHEPHGCETYNIGTGKSVSNEELLATVQKVHGPLEVSYGDAIQNVPDLYFSSEKARVALGWEPSTPLEEGLRNTLS